MSDGRNGPISPFFKKVIELSRTLVYISSRESVFSIYLIHRLGDFAGRNSLQIHLCDGEVESSVNSRASFKPGNNGSKGCLRVSYLRDIKCNLSGGDSNSARLEAITLSISRRYPFLTLTS